MNKYQEALDRIKNKTAIIDGEKMTIGAAYCDTLSILQELVDKETPVKPKFVNKLDWTCPRCDAYHTKFVQYYCEYCGQKLDWSDTND